jgi:hypothetical protein
MLTATTARIVTNNAGTARTFDPWSEHEEFERCDASRLRRLVKRRLHWYGLGTVEVGSLRLLTKDSLLVDLRHARGAVRCRIEVDRQSGAIKTSTVVLSRLLASHPTQDSWKPKSYLVQ